MRIGLQVQLVGGLVVGRHRGRPLGFGRHQLRLERVGHALRDLALDREDVLQFAVVALRPQVAVVVRVDQLQVDVHLLAGLLHAAFEHGRDTELLGDDLQVRRMARVLRGRRARDHLEVADAGKPSQDLVLHAGREVGVVLVLAEVFERQHGDRLGRSRSALGAATALASRTCCFGVGRAGLRSTNICASISSAMRTSRTMIQRSSLRAVRWTIDSVGVDFALALEAFRRELVEPGERDEQRQADHGGDDDPAHDPFGSVEERKDLGGDLDQQPRGGGVERRGAKYIAALEFTQQRCCSQCSAP